MQPNSEPTPADIAAVSAHLGTPAPAPTPTPEPAPAPAQMQPEAPASQPAPSSQPSDPFASLFASEPAAPTQPVEPSTTPVEPSQPAPEQAPQPTPQPTPAPQPLDDVSVPLTDYETYDEYMARITKGVPQAPAMPDAEKVDPNDPASIKGFFDDLVTTAVAQAEAKMQRQTAIQTSEKRLWDAAMDKYGTLKTNKEVRDMVHNIRIANFQRGIAMTPTQAADRLLDALQKQYNKGVADNQVVTTYEQVQPTGGQSGAPIPTTLDTKSALESVQNGGETALAELLDREIKAGRL